MKPDLSQADLRRMNLNGANLRIANLSGAILNGANLSEADLSEANLRKADLSGAILFGAILRKTDLSQADLRQSKLRGADLGGAILFGADLREADLSDLRGVDLRGADLRGADLRGVDLRRADIREADLSEVDLRSASLQSANLNGAVLTAAKLWETQRAGWSIKKVFCTQAFWDEQGRESTEYADSEFERLHSEQVRIELFYQGGITQFELNTLPALLHRLATSHPACGIRLKSIEEVGGGARVCISVEHGDEDAFNRIEAEARQSQAAQTALRDDPAARLEIEKRLLLDEVIPRILAAAGQHVQVNGDANNLVIASGSASVHARQTINESYAILRLLDQIIKGRGELHIAEDQAARLEDAVSAVKDELHKSEPKPSIVSGGLKVVKEIVIKIIENAAEKALPDHWQPLLDQLTHFVKMLAGSHKG